MTEKIEPNSKPPQFKVNYRVGITKYKNIFRKSYTKNWSREISIMDFVLKTNPSIYEIKDLNRKKMIGNFCEKELLLNKL